LCVQYFWNLLESRSGRVLVAVVALTYATAALGPVPASAQVQQPQHGAAPAADYRVGPGDHLFLSVPQRPDLNRELVVNPEGRVNMPLVGDVLVRGMTADEIEARLLQSLREYYPSINRVDVSITQALSNVIFVTGDVKLPGKYSFAEPVNVWEAIREAGGPMPTATMSGVRVVTDRARGGSSFVVDVQSALEKGSVEDLPILKPGDTVLVPGQEETYTGSAGVNVMGAVIKPGTYRLSGRGDLMSALLVAGGPNERADLGDVRLIRPAGDGLAETRKVDLQRFIEKGDMESNPKLQSGDTIAIGNKAFTSADAALILGFISAMGTLVLLYYTIQNEVQADTAAP
jgi:polysaccharide export outer membrane protein